MKTIFFPIVALLTFTVILNVAAQEFPAKTTWEGKLAGIRLILRLSEDSLSKQNIAVFDSPDQGAVGLAVSKLNISKDSLSAYSSIIGGGFIGKFNSTKTELNGTWKQGGGEMPLTLSKVADKPAYSRPQMPKAPFPYQEEKVIYFNKDKSIQYGATLTLPKSTKAVPVVILITGSGQQDRDETIFGHKLFWVIADYLSRNGIAVLRVDDRGVGQTTGNVMKATSADFAKDVLVGVDYIKTLHGINLKKIGLIGHSEGGVIAPLAALQTKDIAFIISLAGVGIKGADLLNKQTKDAYHNLGLNLDEMKRMLALTNLMVKLGGQYSDQDQLKTEFKKAYNNWSQQQPEALLLKVGLKGPQGDKNINRMAATYFLPWMRYFFKYDPANTLSKLKIPVLAMNGGKDVQVSARENLAGFKKYLTQAGNNDFKTVLFPNLNHLFQNAKTGEVSEYITIQETISPEVLTVMSNWIRQHTK